MLVTWPLTRSLCGVVNTSSEGMLGLQTMPFLAVVAPPAQSGRRQGRRRGRCPAPEMERAVDLLVELWGRSAP